MSGNPNKAGGTLRPEAVAVAYAVQAVLDTVKPEKRIKALHRMIDLAELAQGAAAPIKLPLIPTAADRIARQQADYRLAGSLLTEVARAAIMHSVELHRRKRR